MKNRQKQQQQLERDKKILLLFIGFSSKKMIFKTDIRKQKTTTNKKIQNNLTRIHKHIDWDNYCTTSLKIEKPNRKTKHQRI